MRGACRWPPALLGTLAATWLGAAEARAQPDEGSWPISQALVVGPSACLEAGALSQQIAIWLTRSEIDRRLTVEVTDAADGVHFVVRRDGQVVGRRRLDVERAACQQIHAAVALGVAIALDATVLDQLGVTPPLTAPPLTPAGIAPAVTPPPPASAPPPAPYPPMMPARARADADADAERQNAARRDALLTATVQGVVLVAVLPQVTLGVAPSAELTLLRGFDLRVSGLATATTAIPIGAGRADAGLFAGRLDACASRILLQDVARIRGCAGVIAGVVTARGEGLPDSRTTTAPWVAPAVRVDARWSLSSVFGLVVGVDGFVPGLKPEFQVVDGAGEVTDSETFPLAGLGVGVGPSLTF
jgi:hypothetical protein